MVSMPWGLTLQMNTEKAIVVELKSEDGKKLAKVRHPDGFTDWVELEPYAAALVKVGSEIQARGYETEAERDAEIERLKAKRSELRH
jgi:hypothetical protein